MQENKTKLEKDLLSISDRVGELVLALLLFLLFGFLAYHQAARTGFFTNKFGIFEMLCLYVPLFAGMIPLLIRAWKGQRHVSRPYEIVSSLLLAGGAFWLVMVFPFDFTHLAEALPFGLRFLLQWVTDDMVRIVLILQVIIGLVMAMATLWRYMSIEHEEAEMIFDHQHQTP